MLVEPSFLGDLSFSLILIESHSFFFRCFFFFFHIKFCVLLKEEFQRIHLFQSHYLLIAACLKRVSWNCLVWFNISVSVISFLLIVSFHKLFKTVVLFLNSEKIADFFLAHNSRISLILSFQQRWQILTSTHACVHSNYSISHWYLS